MLYVLAIIAFGFLTLTLLVSLFPTSNIDLYFSREIQEHRRPWLDHFMYWVSCPGYMPQAPIMVTGTALIFFLFKYKKAALYILLTMLGGLVSTLVKVAVNRPRPSDTVVRILQKTTQQSFPSGHVLFYVVFFGFLILLMYQLQGVSRALRATVIGFSLLFIFLIPISRIYMGAHWFTDVLGGFLLGLICLYVLSWFYLRHRANKQEAPVAETQ
jgi:membrane-associated phospholipid phosphatase